MTDDAFLALPYRPNAGLVLLNKSGEIFAGKRIDTPDAWQMPQGGIDKGESAEAAALRELAEETGVAPELVEILAKTGDWLKYDFPPEVALKLFTNKKGKAKYRGQQQRWYLMRFLGEDDQVNIETEEPEFSEWRWMQPDTLLTHIVPFKRDIYRSVFAEFKNWL